MEPCDANHASIALFASETAHSLQTESSSPLGTQWTAPVHQSELLSPIVQMLPAARHNNLQGKAT
jgi:hypothetical protein